MLKIQNKSTKRIRVAQIVFFLIQIYLCTVPYIWGGVVIPGEKSNFTVFDMVSMIGATTGNAETEQMLNYLGVAFIAFIALPVIAVGFQIFDRYYNLKNIISIICSILGVVLIIYFIGGYLCFGSMVALILYLLTLFLSVMGIFARFLKIENTAE